MQGGGRQAAEDGSDDDLFRVRATASAERPVHDLEAENAIDTAVLSTADLNLDRWQADGAMEALRNRFVTGEQYRLATIDNMSCVCTCSTQHDRLQLNAWQADLAITALSGHCHCAVPLGAVCQPSALSLSATLQSRSLLALTAGCLAPMGMLIDQACHCYALSIKH